MGESLERWGIEMQCKGSTSEVVVVVVVWGMGWDGRGSEEICASRLVNHAHAAGLLSIPQSTGACTHTLKHMHKNKQPHTHTQRKTHTHAFNTGRPNCHWSTVCVHSLWHEYSKNTLIIPIIHPCTYIWVHTDATKMPFVQQLRKHMEQKGLVGRTHNTFSVVCCQLWDFPLSLHHWCGLCGLTCQATSLPKVNAFSILRGTPIPERWEMIGWSSGTMTGRDLS